MVKKDTCNGGAALFYINSEHTRTGKIAVLEDLMEMCAETRLKQAKKDGTISKRKRGVKKQMSGYNCYMKSCAKTSGDFKACLLDKGWGKLPEPEKNKYNSMALEGCNI